MFMSDVARRQRKIKIRPPEFESDFIKKIATRIGINNLTRESVAYISTQVTYELMFIVQDAMKFMTHENRDVLASSDIDHALKLKNITPTYSFDVNDSSLLTLSPGLKSGTLDADERRKIVNLQDYITSFNPKSYLSISLKLHWIAIEGIEPIVPENPPPLTDFSPKKVVGPIHKLWYMETDKEIMASPSADRVRVVKSTVHGKKSIVSRQLTTDEWFVYKDITESCVGLDEQRRLKALNRLVADKGLHVLMPHLCTFIQEGVKINVARSTLAVLIYLMRMVKAIADNKNINLSKYAHELFPSIMTCIVSRQLSPRPDIDNHWALRDYASRLLAGVCNSTTTDINHVQIRIVKIFCKTIVNSKIDLASLYGCIEGLAEMGNNVIDGIIMTKLPHISKRLVQCVENPGASKTDKISAGRILELLVKILPPILKELRNPPDVLSDYINDFGYIGRDLHMAMTRIRLGGGGGGW